MSSQSEIDIVHDKLSSLLDEIRELETQTEELRAMEKQVATMEKTCLDRLQILEKQVKEMEQQVISANNPKPELNKRRSSILQMGVALLGRRQLSRETPGLLLQIQRRLTLIKSSLPRPPGLLLKLALGMPTPTIIRPHTARLAYKQNYESFKVQASILQGVFALVDLLFFDNKVFDGIFLLGTLYYYSNMTIRELVLRVNGSRVRPWWVFHHVLTVVLIGVVLIWPQSSSYSKFRTPYLAYAAYLSIIQYLQYRYQMSRLYTMRALGSLSSDVDAQGKVEVVTSMETVAGEGVVPRRGIDLDLLMPFLVVGQVAQIVLGGWCLYLFKQNPREPWQLLLTGLLFLTLGMGNFAATISTVQEKKVKETRVKRLGGQGDRNRSPSPIRRSAPIANPNSEEPRKRVLSGADLKAMYLRELAKT